MTPSAQSTRRSLGAILTCLGASLAACSDSGADDGGGGAGTSGGSSGSSGIAGKSNGGAMASGGLSAAGAVSFGGASDRGGSGGTSGKSGGGGVSGSLGTSAGAGGKVDVSGGSGGTSGKSTGGVSAGGAPSTGAGGTSAGGTSAGGTGGANGGSSGSGGKSGTAGAPSTCPPATPLTGGRRFCSNTTGNAGGNYSYELWAEGPGSGCMTVYGKDATFGATWTNVEDFLARVGLQFDRTRRHAQIGTITAEFAETKTGSNGLVYIGIYGWTVNPLREFYILDDWGETKPAGTASDGTPRDFVGMINVDGENYDVWKKTRVNKPAITGPNETFDQYFSIRQKARQCGRISVSEQFTKWEALGIPLGNLTEVKLLMEAQASSGTIEFTKATVVVD